MPQEGRILYTPLALHTHLLKGAVTRALAAQTGMERNVFTLNGMTVVPVPQAPCYLK